jgi:hypothetical protein
VLRLWAPCEVGNLQVLEDDHLEAVNQLVRLLVGKVPALPRNPAVGFPDEPLEAFPPVTPYPPEEPLDSNVPYHSYTSTFHIV